MSKRYINDQQDAAKEAEGPAEAKAKERDAPKKTINKKSTKPSPKYSPKPSGSKSGYEFFSLEGTRQTPASLKAAEDAYNDLAAEMAEYADDSVADA